nr:hypothetical protein [uncultured Prevotella sp.]
MTSILLISAVSTLFLIEAFIVITTLPPSSSLLKPPTIGTSFLFASKMSSSPFFVGWRFDTIASPIISPENMNFFRVNVYVPLFSSVTIIVASSGAAEMPSCNFPL